jgi:hypothetical protein
MDVCLKSGGGGLLVLPFVEIPWLLFPVAHLISS